jgi:hypothetical protein
MVMLYDATVMDKKWKETTQLTHILGGKTCARGHQTERKKMNSSVTASSAAAAWMRRTSQSCSCSVDSARRRKRPWRFHPRSRHDELQLQAMARTTNSGGFPSVEQGEMEKREGEMEVRHGTGREKRARVLGSGA